MNPWKINACATQTALVYLKLLIICSVNRWFIKCERPGDITGKLECDVFVLLVCPLEIKLGQSVTCTNVAIKRGWGLKFKYQEMKYHVSESSGQETLTCPFFNDVFFVQLWLKFVMHTWNQSLVLDVGAYRSWRISGVWRLHVSCRSTLNRTDHLLVQLVLS